MVSGETIFSRETHLLAIPVTIAAHNKIFTMIHFEWYCFGRTVRLSEYRYGSSSLSHEYLLYINTQKKRHGSGLDEDPTGGGSLVILQWKNVLREYNPAGIEMCVRYIERKLNFI